MTFNLLDTSEPFVAFVGAGASAIPPSNLPSWTKFNDILLECLCDRLAEYSQGRQPTTQILNAFRARRDKTQFLAPDFQAQLIEEEVGADYFRVWQSIESNVVSPVHEDLAELAVKGRLAAIITTNFDQLIETALRARNINPVIYYDRATYEKLAVDGTFLDENNVAVIKIHGTIERPSSLVDTLKQRLAGRPVPLMTAIQLLLRKHPWLFLGFSGADFSYDRNYLGIRDAVDTARGFVFLMRPGTNVQQGVKELCNAFGEDKASIVRGDLRTWLSETFDLPQRETAVPVAHITPPPVKLRVSEWTRQLGNMSIVNILCAMLKSAGMEHDSLWLLRKTWNAYRAPDEMKGPSYARYNYNYGLALLECGFIANPIKLADDKHNIMEWREQADQNAFEYFGRSYTQENLLPAGAQLACVLAYRGEFERAIGLMSEVTDKALLQNRELDLCDIAIASGVLYDLIFIFRPAIKQFEHCLEICRRSGDEPRRAVLCALLGRFHTYTRAFDEASGFLDEAERIANRLDLRSVKLDILAVRGLWLADSRASPEDAVRMLQEVLIALRANEDVPIFVNINLSQNQPRLNAIKGRYPIRCRVLLDLNRAAMLAGDAGTVDSTLDELDETIEHFPGYAPLYYLNYAQCILRTEDNREKAAELIETALLLGEKGGNCGVVQAAQHLRNYV